MESRYARGVDVDQIRLQDKNLAALLDRFEEDLPAIVPGGDHPYIQWWGTNGKNGMAAMYLDRGIRPYIAINVDSTDGPGSTNMMSWEQCRQLQERGVEFVAHGAWHVDKWHRINTGMRIEYLGANGTATVQVTATQVVCTAGADSVTSTLATDTTLNAVKATIEAINGGGKWRVTLDAILTGSEASSNLFAMNAARNVLASTANTYFCAGGGLELQYTARTYKHVWCRKTTSNTFTIWSDGVQVYSLALGTNSFSTLLTAINALSGTDYVAKLCDNGNAEAVLAGSSKPTYMVGDELATNMKAMLYKDISHRPSLSSGGIPMWKIVDLHMEYTKTVAAANGIWLRHFAQSGSAFYPWMTDHAAYGMYRGNPFSLANTPYIMPRYRTREFITHRTLTDGGGGVGTHGAAQVACIPEAMSGGGDVHNAEPFVFCSNVHKVLRDGTSGYSLPDSDQSYYDQTEASLNTYIKNMEIFKGKGLLRTMTPSELFNVKKSKRPRNLLINPRLINSGSAGKPAAGSQDFGYWIPGCAAIRGSNMTTYDVSSGVLSVVANSTTAVEVLGWDVYLEPGKSYELTAYMDVSAWSAGNGVSWSFQSAYGQMKGIQTPETNYKITGEQAFETGFVKLRVTVPKPENFVPPQIISIAGPWNLTTNKNIKLNILSVGAVDNIDCSVGAGSAAAVKAKEAAAAINAAIAADAAYASLSQYHSIASADSNKLIITAPTIGTDQLSPIALSAAGSVSATAVIFGNATGEGRPQFLNPATAENYPFHVGLRWSMTATANLYGFSMREVDYN